MLGGEKSVKAKKEERSKTTFDDALSQTGFGKCNYLILFAAGGCLMVVIVETMAMMFIAPASQCDLELKLDTKSLLSAISFLGVVASSHMWGFIADTRGRRNVLIISMFVSFLTSVLSSIVPYDWLFILVRFINGFFVGGASAVAYAYVGEFQDNKHRPKIVSWTSTFVAVGNILIPGFAWLILPSDFIYYVPWLDITFRPWRLLVICYGTPALFFAFWLLILPESPKYLLAQGDVEKCIEVLRWMYSMNTGKAPDTYPVHELIIEGEVDDAEKKKKGLFKTMFRQTAPLFKKPYLVKTVLVCCLQFGTFFSSSGFLMWFPEMTNRMSTFSSENIDEAVTMCKSVDYYNSHQGNSTENYTCDDHVNTDSYLPSLIIGSVYMVMYILMGIIINAVGPKRILVVYLVTTAAAGIASQYMDDQIWIEVLLIVFFLEATSVGVITTIVVDLFPTNLRAMAVALSLMCGRFGAMAGSNATGPLIYDACKYLFYVYGLDHLLLLIFVFMLPTSPKEKKMIEPKV